MRRLSVLYSLLAGTCDTATGVLLLGAPRSTLEILGIEPVPAEPAVVYLRWIGVFVGSVGLSYLYPFLLAGGVRRARRLRTVFEVTALVRLAVAAFVLLQVVGRALVPAWLSVSFTDLGLAAVQLGLLAGGHLGDPQESDR